MVFSAIEVGGEGFRVDARCEVLSVDMFDS